MDTDASGTEATSNEEAVPGKTGMPPPVILTSTTNLIPFQKQLQSVVKENLESESSRVAWWISNPSNLTSTPLTCPITRSTPNPTTHEGGDMIPATQHPRRRYV
jgi:hypothetical protein